LLEKLSVNFGEISAPIPQIERIISK